MDYLKKLSVILVAGVALSGCAGKGSRVKQSSNDEMLIPLEKPFEIAISKDGYTRFSIEDERIKDVSFYPQENIQIKIHDQGYLIVAPKQLEENLEENAKIETNHNSEKIYVTITGEYGIKQGFALSFKNQKPQTIKFVKSSKELVQTNKNRKDYIPSTAIAKATLEIGTVVGTNSKERSDEELMILRLTDAAKLFDKYYAEQIKGAVLIGYCRGDLSSERAKCRLQTLSLKNDDGEFIERQVQGWIVGEDGYNGIKGELNNSSGLVISPGRKVEVAFEQSVDLRGCAGKGLAYASEESTKKRNKITTDWFNSSIKEVN